MSKRPCNMYRDTDISPRDLGDSVKVSLECGGRAPGVEKCKAPSTGLKWQEAMKCNYFPFQPVPQKKSTQKKWYSQVRPRARGLDSRLSPFWPRPGPQALQVTMGPRGARRQRSLRPGTTDPAPTERRVPGPARAVPRLALLRPCRPHGP